LSAFAMRNVEIVRNDIYNYFHPNKKCQDYFFDPAREEQFVAYSVSPENRLRIAFG